MLRAIGDTIVEPAMLNAPHDFRAVVFDETRFFTVDPEDAADVERIESTYVLDASERTFCCESTPSFWLEYLQTGVVCRADVGEERRGELDEKYAHLGGEGCYMHCSSVEDLPCVKGDFSSMDEAREHWQGNWPF